MNIQPLEILKWIGVALAAGFVGYFGRYLAMIILDKIHKKKPETSNAENAAANNRRDEATFNGSSHAGKEKSQTGNQAS